MSARDDKECSVIAAGQVEHVSVAVQEDFVARQTRAKVIPALAEMIWNGLDADANRIDVEFSYDDLAGGMSKIFVHDDGDGFPRGELIEENRARLQFFQEHLQHTADESAAIRYLQEKHSKFLEGVFVEEDVETPETAEQTL
jgi:Histidine kinase-, DNA gyrase B-, and HSP90-like ATPase